MMMRTPSPPQVRRASAPLPAAPSSAEQCIAHLGSAAVLLDGSLRVTAVNKALEVLGVRGTVGKEFLHCVEAQHKSAVAQAIKTAQQGASSQPAASEAPQAAQHTVR